jgi:hypothetical protein
MLNARFMKFKKKQHKSTTIFSVIEEFAKYLANREK